MKSRRLIAVLAAGALLLGGCGETKQQTSGGGGTAEYAITSEPTELTIWLVRSAESKIEELPVWQEFARLTNVSLKTVSSNSISDATQAFNTLMASGDLPDLVAYDLGRDAFSKFGVEGAFARLDELVNEEDTPNLAYQFGRSVVKNYITAEDGHIYYVPCINPPTVAEGWFIRQDWLDKLGIPTPTNTEEYYQALVAIRDGDPNGNGEKDEVPYFSRFGRVDDLLTLWDVRVPWDEKDGKVVYAPMTPEFKEAYTNVAKWYAEGLIDKEIYTRGGKSRDKLLGDNVGGSTHDWFGTTAQFNDILAETVPGINFKPIAPPNGAEYYSRQEVANKGVAISATSDKKDIAIKFIDFIFSEPGSRLKNFGIEGVHYDLGEDGRPYFKDWILHGEKSTVNILEDIGAQGGFVGLQDFWYEEQWLTPAAKEGANMYIENNLLVPQFPTLSYTKEEKAEFNKIMTAVQTHVDETCQKWVFGNEDVEESYDQFISDLNSMNIGRAIEIQQAAYDRYLEAQ